MIGLRNRFTSEPKKKPMPAATSTVGRYHGSGERHGRTALQQKVAQDAPSQTGRDGQRHQTRDGEALPHRVQRAAQPSEKDRGEIQIERQSDDIVHAGESTGRRRRRKTGRLGAGASG